MKDDLNLWTGTLSSRKNGSRIVTKTSSMITCYNQNTTKLIKGTMTKCPQPMLNRIREGKGGKKE